MADYGDQVPRLDNWRTEHPGWDIRPPSTASPNWRATSPDRTTEVTATELRDMLNELEKLT